MSDYWTVGNMVVESILLSAHELIMKTITAGVLLRM